MIVISDCVVNSVESPIFDKVYRCAPKHRALVFYEVDAYVQKAIENIKYCVEDFFSFST